MRTDEVIAAEIEALRNLKPKLPRRNGWDEDNHEMVDAQIMTLENRWSRNEVSERHAEAQEDDANDDILYPECNEDAAASTAQWLYETHNAHSPSKDWEPLLKT